MISFNYLEYKTSGINIVGIMQFFVYFIIFHYVQKVRKQFL